MSNEPLTEIEKVALAHTLGSAVALIDFLISKHKLSRKDVFYGSELARIKLEPSDESSDS